MEICCNGLGFRLYSLEWVEISALRWITSKLQVYTRETGVPRKKPEGNPQQKFLKMAMHQVNSKLQLVYAKIRCALKRNEPMCFHLPCSIKVQICEKKASLIIRGNSKVSVFLLPIGKNGIIMIASFAWMGFAYARYASMFGKKWYAVMAAQKYLLSWNWIQNREHTKGFN